MTEHPPLSDPQAERVDLLIDLGWSMIRREDFTGATAVYDAAKRTEVGSLELFVAVRPDGSHKFYRNLRRVPSS